MVPVDLAVANYLPVFVYAPQKPLNHTAFLTPIAERTGARARSGTIQSPRAAEHSSGHCPRRKESAPFLECFAGVTSLADTAVKCYDFFGVIKGGEGVIGG